MVRSSDEIELQGIHDLVPLSLDTRSPASKSIRAHGFSILLFISSLALVLRLSYYFGVFSTLHVYLVLVCFTVPVLFLRDTLRWMTGRYKYSREHIPRTIAFLCVILYVLLSLLWMPNTYIPTLAPKGTYFIAANLFNSEHIMPQFSHALLRIADEVGHDRIFVSIYENNSKDRTPQLLHALDQRLAEKGVAHRIRTEVLPDTFYHQDRIQKLVTLRNRALELLYAEARDGLNGHSFDKLVFINDVFFTPETFYKLIRTENGQFDQACAVDYVKLGIYDTWVVRDANARAPRPLYPFFYSWRDQAIVFRRGSVPVNSCWNGITAFDARWFLPATNSTSSTPPKNTSSDTPAISRLSFPIPSYDDSSDGPAQLPLRFCTSNICYESECLLSSLDMHRIARPLRPRIFLNTDLAVAYDKPNFLMYDWLLRWPLVYPWHLLWVRLISVGLFPSVGDIHRITHLCEIKNLNHLWVPP